MTSVIITSLISGLCVAIPSIIATLSANKKSNAIIEMRIKSLEDETKKHNQLIDRMYKVESRVTVIEDELKK